MQVYTRLLARAERLWRQFGTGLSFSMFGLGGLFLALFVFPALNVFIRDDQRRAAAAQRIVHISWRLFIWFMRTLGVMEFDSQGGDVLRGEQGTLVVANHPSLIDVVLIMSLMRCTQCVVKPGVWRNPFMRGVVRATGYIPNLGDPEKLIDDCVRALRAGNNLVIFPEGSRTVPGEKIRIQRGFANIALRAMAPIRIVLMSCDPPTLRKGEKWYQSPAKKPHFRLRVCERVDPHPFAKSEPSSLAVRSLARHIAQRLSEVPANA